MGVLDEYDPLFDLLSVMGFAQVQHG